MQQSVALCDSRRLFGDALSLLIAKEPDLVFAGQAIDSVEAQRLLDERHPDLLLLDAGFRDASAADLARDWLAQHPRLKVVLLADDVLSGPVEPIIAAGIKAIVLRQQPWATVVEALRLALRGQSYVAPELSSRTVSGPPMQAPSPSGRPVGRGLERLTARERQIFDLIVSGYKNQEIATLLGVSIKTVETHRASINRKLSVHSTGQMIRFAATQGLIPQSSDYAPPRKIEAMTLAPPALAVESAVAVR